MLNTEDSVKKVTLHDGLPVYYMRNGQIIRSRLTNKIYDASTTLHFQGSVLYYNINLCLGQCHCQRANE